MSKYSKVKFGRVYQLNFAPGDDILECVQKLVDKEKLHYATFFAGAGNLINCHTHIADDKTQTDVHVHINDTPMELCGLQGFIEDGWKVHLHGVTTYGDVTRTVHLHEGNIVLHECRLTVVEILD